MTSSGAFVVPGYIQKIVLFLFVLISSANADAITAETPGVVDQEVTDPVSTTQKFGADGKNYFTISSAVNIEDVFHIFANTSSVVLHEGTGMIYSDLALIPADTSSARTTTVLQPRSTVQYDEGYYFTWRQVQTANQGDWWSEWYPVSPCVEVGQDEGVKGVNFTYQYNYDWSITPGSTISWDVAFASIDSSVSESVSYGGELTCNVKPGSVGQAWYQQHMQWADLQEQMCVRDAYDEVTCGEWSDYYRVNAPFSGPVDANLGCSTGWEHVRC